MNISKEINEHIARMKDEDKQDRIIKCGICIYKNKCYHGTKVCACRVRQGKRKLYRTAYIKWKLAR